MDELMYTPPMDEIWTPKKKYQSADTNTQKLRNFCLTPQKKRKDQRMPMHTTPQKQLFQGTSSGRRICITDYVIS